MIVGITDKDSTLAGAWRRRPMAEVADARNLESTSAVVAIGSGRFMGMSRS